MILLSEAEMTEAFLRWQKQNPSPVSELEYKNPYTLLIAVVLSAQATDKSVNKATKALFEKVTSPQQMLDLGYDKLLPYIKSIGLYKNKGANIIKLSKMLVEEYNSEVPGTKEELVKLPGVGPKTANVVLNVIFKQPTMPVDTHILRIAPKIGLAPGSTPGEVEKGLLKRIPPEFLFNAHHWILLHGRYVCTAKNPKCSECLIADLCKHN